MEKVGPRPSGAAGRILKKGPFPPPRTFLDAGVALHRVKRGGLRGENKRRTTELPRGSRLFCPSSTGTWNLELWNYSISFRCIWGLCSLAPASVSKAIALQLQRQRRNALGQRADGDPQRHHFEVGLAHHPQRLLRQQVMRNAIGEVAWF